MRIFGIDVNNYFDRAPAYCVDIMWIASWRDLRDAISEETNGGGRIYCSARSGAGVESFAEQAESANFPPGSGYDCVVVVGDGIPI